MDSLAPPSSLSTVELVRKCANSKDVEAWRELVRRFHPVVAASILRTSRRWCEAPRQLIDDLIQDTYVKLCSDNCRLLRTFQPQHPDSIYGYLQVMAANVVHDHFKAEHAGKRGAGRQPESLDPGEPHPGTTATVAGSSESIERRVRLREIDEALALVGSGPDHDRNCMIFFLYYRQGFTAREIASLPSLGLTTKGVESIIARLTRMIRSHINPEGFGQANSL